MDARTHPEGESAIKVSSLRKEFTGPDGEPIVAVDDIDFEIKPSEFFTLVGPSGCGKTTTLRCIAGLEKPSRGRIHFDRLGDVTDLPPNKRQLAMMFQNIALYPHMKVKDNIAYPLKVRNVPKAERYKRAEECAEIVQISELLEKYPGELSGGQRQRAALARTIVHDPIAFLMDEPLSDLDAKLKVEIRTEIQRIHRRVERPTLYVTHDQEEAMTMSDRIAVMKDGDIEQIGTPNELYRYPRNRFVAEFIGMPSMNFVNGTLHEFSQDEASVLVNGYEFLFTLEKAGVQPSSEGVTLGFRPEVVSLDEITDAGDLEGKITLLEQIGDRKLAYIQNDYSHKEIKATVPADTTIREEDTVSLTIDRDGLYLFDSTSEEFVAKGGK